MARRVRNSGKAVIIRDGEILLAHMRDPDGTDWYMLPGGGQEVGEPLTETVRREVREETGLIVEPTELLFVLESQSDSAAHRVHHIFACDLSNEAHHVPHLPDSGQIGIVWMPITSLHETELYPSKLRRAIQRWHTSEPVPVYLGSENPGDPVDTS